MGTPGAVGVRKVRRMRENASLGIIMGEGLHTVKPFIPEPGPRKNAPFCEIADVENGNESDLLSTLSDGSHARSCRATRTGE